MNGQRELFERSPPQPISKTNEADLYVMDPNWSKDNGGGGRGAQTKYKTASKEEIYTTVTTATWSDGSLVFVPAKESHLRLWCTTLSILDALWLLERLGFQYSTFDVWIKYSDDSLLIQRIGELVRDAVTAVINLRRQVRDIPEELLQAILSPLETAIDLMDSENPRTGQIGIGRYRRSCHEVMLYGRRGPFARGPLASTTLSVIGGRALPVTRYTQGPKKGTRIHSRKPPEAYEHVEDTSPYTRRVSMYERGVAREGWRFWGDEVGMFDT